MVRYRDHTYRRAPGQRNDWDLYVRLLSYVLPQWQFLLLSLLGYLLYSLGNVLLADLMQFLLDALGGVTENSRGILSTLSRYWYPDHHGSDIEHARVAVPIALVTLALMRASGFFIGSYFVTHVSRHLIHRLRCDLFDKMLVAPSDYYDSNSQGSLMSRITFNVDQVTGAATKAVNVVLREGLTVAALVTYMFYLNWRLCLIFVAVAPLIALVVRTVGRHFRRYSRRIQSSMGDVAEVSRETVAAYREIRLFAAQQQQSERFLAASDYNRAQSLKLARVEAFSTPVIQGLLALALALIVWFALSPGILAGFSAGALVAFLTAAGQLGKPVRQLSGVQSVIQRGLAASEDIFAQLDMVSERDAGGYKTPRARGSIRFESVSFAYPGTDILALDHVTIEIQPGKTVALVGRSGSGKTTLVQLLARFYSPDAGQILLDGVPLADYQLANLREQIAIVPQEVSLFRDSIFNNIAYGSLSGKPKAAVLEAARAAHADEFIQSMPMTYQTEIREGSARLSGGQRQRIGIARALLKDAPILILDEATSALDYESEALVSDALSSVMAGRTTIVIAHRLSTVERADTIVVLDAGHVVDYGTHSQLLERGGLYAQLYARGFTD